MELKKMTDQELASRIVNYVERIQTLIDQVSPFIHHTTRMVEQYEIDLIREEYKRLKADIKEDAHYLGLARNERNDNRSKLYNAFFEPSIGEAAAFGFMAPTNSRIDFKFYDALEEAQYKLTKYYSLDDWRKIAQGQDTES